MITGSILALVLGVLAIALAGALVFGVVTLALAANGGPAACEPQGGPLVIDDAQAASFDQKWDTFQDAIDAVNAGEAPDPARFVAFNESEISSRANTWADQRNIPIDDIRVCLDDGYGVGTGTVSILGFDTKVRVKGSVQLNENSAQPRVDEMQIGSLPGWMSGPLRRFVNSELDRTAVDVVNAQQYRVLIAQGRGAVVASV
jgi:hypothetical protein